MSLVTSKNAVVSLVLTLCAVIPINVRAATSFQQQFDFDKVSLATGNVVMAVNSGFAPLSIVGASASPFRLDFSATNKKTLAGDGGVVVTGTFVEDTAYPAVTNVSGYPSASGCDVGFQMIDHSIQLSPQTRPVQGALVEELVRYDTSANVNSNCTTVSGSPTEAGVDFSLTVLSELTSAGYATWCYQYIVKDNGTLTAQSSVYRLRVDYDGATDCDVSATAL